MKYLSKIVITWILSLALFKIGAVIAYVIITSFLKTIVFVPFMI